MSYKRVYQGGQWLCLLFSSKYCLRWNSCQLFQVPPEMPAMYFLRLLQEGLEELNGRRQHTLSNNILHGKLMVRGWCF